MKKTDLQNETSFNGYQRGRKYVSEENMLKLSEKREKWGESRKRNENCQIFQWSSNEIMVGSSH